MSMWNGCDGISGAYRRYTVSPRDKVILGDSWRRTCERTSPRRDAFDLAAWRSRRPVQSRFADKFPASHIIGRLQGRSDEAPRPYNVRPSDRQPASASLFSALFLFLASFLASFLFFPAAPAVDRPRCRVVRTVVRRYIDLFSGL